MRVITFIPRAQLYQSLAEASSQIIWTTDAQGLVQEDSPSWRAYTGQAYPEFQGAGWAQALHPEDRRSALEAWGLAVATGEPFCHEYRLRSSQGPYRYFLARGVPLREGGKIYAWGRICQDITTHRESLERYRRLAEATSQMVWTTDSAGLVQEDSPSWRAYTGQTLEEFRGQGWSYALHPEDRELALKAWEDSVSREEPFFHEYRVRSAAGAYSHFLARGVPVRYPHGPVREWVRNCLDVTPYREALQRSEERHRVQARAQETLTRVNLELQRKNEENEAFVYMVSHDLRAPLVNLQGFSRELELSCEDLRASLDKLDLPADHRIHEVLEQDIPGALKFIMASTSKFERLIQSLLMLSRTGRVEYRPEDLDMVQLVQRTSDALHQNIKDRKACLRVGDLPRARADATAVGQILANLINNALLYLDSSRPGLIQVGGESQGKLSHYWVGDNGVGIPQHNQASLFQVFSRFHPQLAEGEGVGLALVKRVVERHGGRIWVESQEGVGTTVHWTLPGGEGAGDES